MSHPIGWQAALPEILDLGLAVRKVAPFDEQARAREVARRLADARKFPYWPAIVAVVALALPYGWVWSAAALGLFAFVIVQARRRATALEAQLSDETNRLRVARRLEAERVEGIVAAAGRGRAESLQALLARWAELRPESLRAFSVALGGGSGAAWVLAGHAVRREDVPSGVPRVGRGGRTVLDKRKAGEIDDDVAELNAAAVLSVLMALFSGPDAQQVAVRIVTPHPVTGALVPWVTLTAPIGHRELQQVLSPIGSAVDAIRRLGGDVGRWRNQRITAARELVALQPRIVGSAHETAPQAWSNGDASTEAPRPAAAAPAPPRASAPTPNGAIARTPTDPYGARAVGVRFGSTASEVVTSAASGDASASAGPGRAVPRTPAYLGTSIGLSSAVPSPKNVRGGFATVAQRFAAYPGDPSAAFVPFQSYYATYADMSAAQLRFYFTWRNAVRNKETAPTDLSYVFVHVYELLHLVGAESGEHAARQLEWLWVNYRPTYPKLDGYLVRWIADLYATEVDAAAALEFVQHAATLGAAGGVDEVLLVADQYWARSDYARMPQPGVALLVGDPRLGDNKFYREHNLRDDVAGQQDGGGWVERAYRHALGVADRVFHAKHGRTPRDAVVADGDVRLVAREAFQGAVYDWKRKQVVLGKVPALTETAPAVVLYRNAVRYAENLLRKERGFASKLRGVEVNAELARALDAEVAAYVRATRPRAKVTIDLAKASDLARQSADVRTRLLAGLDEETGTAIARDASAPAAAPPPEGRGEGVAPNGIGAIADAGPSPEHLAAGLLTDLDAVRSAIAAISAPARALLVALAAHGWEAPEADAELKAAVSGALVAPLVDEINARSVDAIGDVLLVGEGDALVVQEDFRDEVYWVLNGTLDGFGKTLGPAPEAAPADAATDASLAVEVRSSVISEPETDGFGPLELRALAAVAAAGDVWAALSALASGSAVTPLLLLDRVNENALGSPYGDIVVDPDQSPPRVIADARPYVDELLARVRPLLLRLSPEVAEQEPAAVAAST